MIIRNMQLLIIYACVVLALGLSCQLPSRETNILKSVSVQAQTFTISNTSDTLIFGSKGVGIVFQKASFEFLDGTVPHGNVVIELREFVGITDMILENLSTTSGARLLETNGMVHISASSDKRELRLAKSKYMILNYPWEIGAEGRPFQLFYGNVNQTNKVDWEPDTTMSAAPVSTDSAITSKTYLNEFALKYKSYRDSIITKMDKHDLDYYMFAATKLGWINCDFFWESPGEKIDFVVKVKTGVDANIKLVFLNAKSIMNGEVNNDSVVFRNVPIDEDVKIVGISFKDAQPLMSVSVSRTTKQPFDKLNYLPFSIEDLRKQLDGEQPNPKD